MFLLQVKNGDPATVQKGSTQSIRVMADSSNAIEKCGENSFCTNYQYCDNGTFVTDGTQLRDIRSVSSYASKCTHYLDVCCKIGNILPEVKPKTLPSAVASEDEKPPQCGFRNKQGLGPQLNTVNDSQAKFGKKFF
ncbi:unnamed protein product [Diamesa hyperborea]